MPFESNKPFKVCPICGKDVRNIGMHIANMHPKEFEHIDTQAAVNSIPPAAASVSEARTAPLNIDALIRRKLETMLDIKIIEMLSADKSPSLTELHAALNPPRNPTIQDLKDFHDLVYKNQDSGNLDKLSEIDTGNNWANVALQALPLIKDMLPGKKAAIEQQQIKISEVKQNVREGNSGRTGILKPISGEIAGNTGKPGSSSEKPGITSQAKQ